MSAPLLVVEHLGLATKAGPVFSDVSFTVAPDAVTVVVGPSGSGRSALLLAVTGRMRDLTGSVSLATRPHTRPRDLRAVTSVARLSTLVQPEDRLTVAESVTERALVDGVDPAAAEQVVAGLEELLGVGFGRDLLVDQLDAYEQTLLCVALALVRPAELVVLDDADRSLDVATQRRLFDALTRLAAAGHALLVSTAEIAAVPASAALVPLPSPQPPSPQPPAPPAPADAAAPPTPKKTA